MTVFTKRQLRQVSPTARKVARLAGEVDSITKRMDGSATDPQLTGELASVATRLRSLIPDLKVLDKRSESLAEIRSVFMRQWNEHRTELGQEPQEVALTVKETQDIGMEMLLTD